MPCLNCEKVFEKGEPFYRLPDGLLKVCLECEAKAKADIERLDGVPFGYYPFKTPYQPLINGKARPLINQSYIPLIKRNYDRLRKLPGEVIIIKKGKPPLEERGRKKTRAVWRKRRPPFEYSTPRGKTR